MRRYLRFALPILIFALVGLGLAYLRINSRVPEYESTAVVIVRPNEFFPKPPAGMPSPVDARYDGFVHAPPNVEQVLEKHGAAKIECLRHSETPLDEFRSRLAVESLDDAGRTIEVRFVATKPEDAQQVVTALVTVNKELLGDLPAEAAARSSDGLVHFMMAREESLKDLQRHQKLLADFQSGVPRERPDREELARRRSRLLELESRLGKQDVSVDLLRKQNDDWSVLEKDEDEMVGAVDRDRRLLEQIAQRIEEELKKPKVKVEPTFVVSVTPTAGVRVYRNAPSTLLYFVGGGALLGMIVTVLRAWRLLD